MFAILTGDLRIAYASTALRQFLGRTELDGAALLEHVLQRDAIEASLTALAADGASRPALRFRIAGTHGRVADATATVVGDGGSRVLCVESRVRSSGEWSGAGVLVGDMLERIHDAVCAVDGAWRFVYMNRAAEVTLRVRREEVLGRVAWDAFPMAKGTVVEEQLRRVRATSQPSSFVTSSPTMGRWTRVNVYPTGENLVVYWQDIDEERRMKAELEASQAQVRSIFENANAGMILASRRGDILAANPQACAILRRSEAELAALNRADLVDPSDPRAAFTDGSDAPRRTSMFLLRGDGTRVEVDVAVAEFADARGEPMVSLVLLDNTERRRAQRMMEILARAGELTASLDLEKTLEALVGLLVPPLVDVAGAEVTTADGRTLVVGEMPGPGLPQLELALETPTRRYGTLRVGSRDTSYRFEVEDVFLFRSIAHRAALAIENDLAHADAVASRRLRDEVLAVVAHDLRSPLGSALLATRLLEGRVGKTEETTAIGRCLTRAHRLIEDLLLATRIETGKLPVELRDEGVSEVVLDVLASFAEAARASDVQLLATVEPPSLRASIDRERIVQLLSNLVENALRFTPRGGKVVVSAAIEDGSLLICVRDDGAGITAEQLPHVFDRFWQGARERRAGAGLGLAIAKGVAEAHGGTITVSSREGEGTCFSVALPLG